MDNIDILKERLAYYQRLLNKYKGYLGSPNDDCILGIYGYTVREERSFLRERVAYYKNAIKEYKNQNNQ